jgi:hypothetical protein
MNLLYKYIVYINPHFSWHFYSFHLFLVSIPLDKMSKLFMHLWYVVPMWKSWELAIVNGEILQQRKRAKIILSYIPQRKKRKVALVKLVIGMIEISFWVWRWDKWYSLERYIWGKVGIIFESRCGSNFVSPSLLLEKSTLAYFSRRNIFVSFAL